MGKCPRRGEKLKYLHLGHPIGGPGLVPDPEADLLHLGHQLRPVGGVAQGHDDLVNVQQGYVLVMIKVTVQAVIVSYQLVLPIGASF